MVVGGEVQGTRRSSSCKSNRGSRSSSDNADWMDTLGNRVCNDIGTGVCKSIGGSGVARSIASCSDNSYISRSGPMEVETNGLYVSRDSYIACADLEKVQRERADQLDKRVRELESQLESATSTNYGRNNITKRKWEGNDVTNIDNLNKWLRGKLFPLCKFLPKTWKNYTARGGTLCARILAVVKVPRNDSVKDYWDSRIVPMVNKKYVEMRSNINSSCRREYQQSKFNFIIVNSSYIIYLIMVSTLMW